MTSLASLIEPIYDAALGPEEQWRAVFGRIGRSIGVAAAGVKLQGLADDNFVQQTWHGLPAGFERAFLSDFWREDPWTLGSFHHEPGTFLLSRDMVPNAVLLRSRFYGELCVPFGLHDAMGACLFRTDDVYVTFGMMRHAGARGDGSALAAHGATLLPHLARATRLRLAAERRGAVPSAMCAAFDQSAVATLIVDAATVIRAGNAHARRLQSEGGLPPVGEKLAGTTAAHTHRLRTAVHRCTLGDARASQIVVLRRVLGEVAACALVRPIVGASAQRIPAEKPLALVYILESRRPASLQAAVLRVLYGLTVAESRLCQLLMEGLSPAEAATQLGRRVSTVRSQLSAALAKTGTSRQTELMRLLSGLAGQIGTLPTL